MPTSRRTRLPPRPGLLAVLCGAALAWAPATAATRAQDAPSQAAPGPAAPGQGAAGQETAGQGAPSRVGTPLPPAQAGGRGVSVQAFGAIPPSGEQARGRPYVAMGLDNGLGAAVDPGLDGGRFVWFARLAAGYGHAFDAGWLEAVAFFEGGTRNFGWGGGAKVGFITHEGFAVDAGAAWLGRPGGAGVHVALGWFYLALEYRWVSDPDADARHVLTIRARLPLGRFFPG